MVVGVEEPPACPSGETSAVDPSWAEVKVDERQSTTATIDRTALRMVPPRERVLKEAEVYITYGYTVYNDVVVYCNEVAVLC